MKFFISNPEIVVSDIFTSQIVPMTTPEGKPFFIYMLVAKI
jgi:hypothetical protein